MPDSIPSASWAVVPAGGIVSVELHSVHQPVLSAIMLWLAVEGWLVLAVRLVYGRDRFMSEARSPAAFADVVGTAVLGTWFAMQGDIAVAAVLLALAVAWWALLVVPVLRHSRTPIVGVSFLLAIGSESLAVLGGILTVGYRAGWPLNAAVAALFLGLAFSVFTAARFDLRELVNGRGNQWVAGGALGASALAAAKVTGGCHWLLRRGASSAPARSAS